MSKVKLWNEMIKDFQDTIKRCEDGIAESTKAIEFYEKLILEETKAKN